MKQQRKQLILTYRYIPESYIKYIYEFGMKIYVTDFVNQLLSQKE